MYDVLTESQAIVEELRATSLASEQARRVDDRAIGLLRGAGLSQLMTPAAYGGHQSAPRALAFSCAITARGCPSASWVQMVCGAHTFMVGMFPKQCQDEVFDGSPAVLIPGTPGAQGTCKRTDGGCLVNGRWQVCSGVDHGTWILAGARGIPDNSGNSTPNLFVVMPSADVIIDDTWHVLGMRGTGSKDIVLEDVFVPDYRTVDAAQAMAGTAPGIEISAYRLPVMSVLSTVLFGSVLGMAEEGLAEFINQTKVREDIYVGGSKASKPGLQMRIAEASKEIELARMVLERNCDLLDAAMKNSTVMALDERAAVRWNSAYGGELCRRATERMYAVAGGHATYDVNALQRFHRNITTATHHAILEFDTVAEVTGQLTLGIEPKYGFI